jgi:hypothetical protein
VIKFFAITLPEKVFLSIGEIDKSLMNYFSASYIYTLYFDGVKGLKTFKRNWVELPSLPKEVKMLKQEIRKVVSFHLKEGYLPSEALPKELPPDYFLGKNEGNSIYELYDKIYEVVSPETFIDVEFLISKLADRSSGWTFKEIPNGIRHSLLDEIRVHPDLLQDTPCELTREESFRIIREYIKKNIDLRFSAISSDYEFCLSVVKIIPRSEKEPFQINVGKKKPKVETQFRDNRKLECYSIAPKEYQDYPIVVPFRGNSYDDLKKNIQVFLEDLMKKINEPLMDCPHCKGLGVILFEVDK